MRGLDCWDEIRRHIPLSEQRRVRWELEGAATAHGVYYVPDLTLTSDEVRMLAERFADQMLELCDIEKLYL